MAKKKRVKSQNKGFPLKIVSNTFYNGEVVKAGQIIYVDEDFYQRVLSEKNKHFE